MLLLRKASGEEDKDNEIICLHAGEEEAREDPEVQLATPFVVFPVPSNNSYLRDFSAYIPAFSILEPPNPKISSRTNV